MKGGGKNNGKWTYATTVSVDWAGQLMKDNVEMIDLWLLYRNTTDWAFQMLKENLDKIAWQYG